MDESEQRRQRLQAMRLGAAAQAKPSENQNFSGGSSHQLLNPLADPTFSNTQRSPSTPRFDYYTDPMSAYSGNKRRGNAPPNSNLPNKFPSPAYDASRGLIPSPCSGQRSANMTPFPVPANQFQVNHSPCHGPFGMQSSFPHPTSQPASAAGTATPMSSHSYSQGNMSANNRPANSTPSHGFRSPSSGSRGGFVSSGSQSGGGSWSAGRGSRGRGYNPRFGNSPGRSGWSSSGQKGPLSALTNPEMYYNRGMLEDPWDQLIPVTGNLLSPLGAEKTPASLKSWMPNSIAHREARVETARRFNPQPSRSSLAEYLAQSFEEAANDTGEV